MPELYTESENLGLHCVQVIDHVTQSQYALELLLPQGDYAGALDIMSDIQVSTCFLTSHHDLITILQMDSLACFSIAPVLASLRAPQLLSLAHASSLAQGL